MKHEKYNLKLVANSICKAEKKFYIMFCTKSIKSNKECDPRCLLINQKLNGQFRL